MRGGIFPFLDSLDILALRYTNKLLKFDTRNIPVVISEAHNRTTKYWSWLYSTLECWCYECYPMQLYLHWITRIASPRTVAAFFNSHRYRMVMRHCWEVTKSAMMGACARGDIRIARLVRGSVPSLAYNREEVLYEACKHKHTKLFIWLIDIGDIPAADNWVAFQICTLIGEQGNLQMLRALMARGFDMSTEHWWLVAVHAMRLRHDHVTRLVSLCAPVDIFDRRHLMATITYDNTFAFRVCLEKGSWPTIDDSVHLRLYNARKVAKLWYHISIPLLPHIRGWIQAWLDG